MSGMDCTGSGIGWRVSGAKGGGEVSFSGIEGEGSKGGERRLSCGAGRVLVFAKGRSSEERRGGTWALGGGAAGTCEVGAVAVAGLDCCAVGCVWRGGSASKLNGRYWLFGGGRGDASEMSVSFFASSVFGLGDGVISGVIVSTI